MAKVITVFNQKGGVGKTTISVHVAGLLARAGHRVLLVDADPQASATSWITAAEEADMLPLRVTNLSSAGRKLHTQIRPYLDDHDFIVVDCPPNINSACTRSALLVADLAVMPIVPSPADVWATENAETLIDETLATNADMKVVLAFNQFDKRRMLGQALEDAVKDMSAEQLRSSLKHREAFRKAAAMGQLVSDVPDEAAAFEVRKMVNEMLSHLGEEL